MSEKRPTCGDLSGHRTKAGKPCSAFPLKGQGVCLAHSDADTRASVGFVPEAGKLGGRPRVPTPTEVAKQLIEDNVAVVLQPHFAVLGYNVVLDEEKGKLALEPREGGGAKIFGESREGVVKMSTFDDLGAMMTAADKLLDRIYGRPKQATELSGPGGGPIDLDVISVPTDQEFHEGVAGILAAAGAVDGVGG